MEFRGFPKIARLNRDITVSEKIDGTNASITIEPTLGASAENAVAYRPLGIAGGELMFAGSRTRFITPTDDNAGFAKWVQANADHLWALGPGTHYGEWWGGKIQRGYGLTEKRFSLFNVSRWHAVGAQPFENVPGNPKLPSTFSTEAPSVVSVVPVLYRGPFHSALVAGTLERLRETGSHAAPGFMNPEGIVVFHEAAQQLFKVTIEGDAAPKGRNNA